MILHAPRWPVAQWPLADAILEGMDAKTRAVIRAMKRQLAEMRRPGHLKRQHARLRLTTAEMVQKGRQTR